MTITRKVALIFLLLVSVVNGSGQNNLNPNPLQIGTKVPDILFEKILNYKSQRAKFSDFKAELLILDYWNVHCPPCIRLFPKLEQLQEKFGDRLCILSIGFDGSYEGSIEKFVESVKGTEKEIRLPVVVQTLQDTMLKRTGLGMPHVVWINKDGIVIAVTDARAVTEKNIQAILDGKKLNLPLKDRERNVSCFDEFLIKRRSGELTYGSVFSGYIDTLINYNWFGRQCDSTVWRFYDINSSVLNLYTNAYKYFFKEIEGDPYKKRIIIESPNIGEFYKDNINTNHLDNWEYANFAKANLFSYELILPRSFTIDEAYRHMIKDFDTYFQIDSKIEKRGVKCLLLVKIADGADLSQSTQSHGGLMKNLVYTSNIKVPIEDVVYSLNAVFKDKLVLNGTTHVGEVSFTLPPSLSGDITKVRNELRKHGYDIIEAVREIPMLVIRDVRKSKTSFNRNMESNEVKQQLN